MLRGPEDSLKIERIFPIVSCGIGRDSSDCHAFNGIMPCWVGFFGGWLFVVVGFFLPILKEVEAERWAVWEDGRAEG